MSLKELIKNQTIIIDDHKRGTGEIKNFDNHQNDVHIDKETNYPFNGKKQRIKIRVPINSDNPIKVENTKGKIEIPGKLKKEIQNAFENKNTRTAFIKDVIEILRNYESSLSTEEIAENILNRLSKHFDLKWNKEKIERYTDEILIAYTQFYTDNKGQNYFIKLESKKITIGQNSGYAKQFKTFNP
ncbi:hypothetical protein [Epilithonimonas sp. UC225_85]|uniref:hypothetical protein n=1 Tax=Epilithonimonas sp. UC225_85 TaxID=3350167 RepID=UPI0036D30BE1